MDAACHRGKNRKYAANSKYAEHTRIIQRLYLRFLCAKRALCSEVPEFAAHFRQTIPEVRGKTEIDQPDPGFIVPRPAVLLAKIELCSEVSDFFLALPENAALHRELKRKSQHPRQHPVVADTSKGRCRKTEQRPFFVIASRRVHDDCITEDILSERPMTLARTDEIDKKEVRRINPFRENQIDL